MSKNTEEAELRAKLAKINAEIADMSSSSYSQSNPYHVLGLRSLRRIKERLEAQLGSHGKT